MSRMRPREPGPTLVESPPLYPPTVSPPPEPLPLLPFLWRFIVNPLRALPQAVYEQPVVVVVRRRTIAWVTGPALVERVLLHEHAQFPKTPLEKRVFAQTLGDGILTSDGPAWRWQRRIAAPLFRHQELLAHVPAMSSAAEEIVARWRGGIDQSPRRVDRDMTDATFSVFTRTLLDGADSGDGELIKRRGADFLEHTSWEVAAAMIGLPEWVWHPGKRQMRTAAVDMRAAIMRIIARRRTVSTGLGSDLLGRLMAARDPESGEPMSDAQLADNLLTFIAAGHETTAKALTWTLYLLARAPAWQQRIRDEVSGVAGAEPVAAAHLARLSLTQRVLKESMRLYPPAPVLTRIAARDVEMEGITLSAGTLVVIPIFAVHRHRRLWEDPDRFDPDRFLPEREALHLRTQFMPFGFGPRTCIGMSFAMLEATAILATLVRAAHFDWDGRHMPEPVSRITLRPKGGMPLSVRLM
jgi:cytochrome P450